ncbi:MAG: hypothetical protein IJ679_07410, partial [Lachnospiraceae bacterium]|nr:hypothetical protein [Lachnospiraceae bacterium]
SDEFGSLLKHMVSEEDIDDVLEAVSRKNVEHMFSAIKESRRIIYNEKDGDLMELSIHPVRIKDERTEAAMILVRDLNPLQEDLFKRISKG